MVRLVRCEAVDVSSTAGGCALDPSAPAQTGGFFFLIVGATLLARLRWAVAQLIRHPQGVPLR